VRVSYGGLEALESCSGPPLLTVANETSAAVWLDWRSGGRGHFY